MTRRTIDTLDLLRAGFEPVDVNGTVYYSFRLVDGTELAIEPLTYGRWAIALYGAGILLLNQKVEVPARRWSSAG